MEALIISVLPQLLVLVGIAGMAWVIARWGFPWGTTVSLERLAALVMHGRQTIARRGLVAVERSLRKAKILAMRAEQFLEARLRALAANKKEIAKPTEGGTFWKSIRERATPFVKPPRRTPPPVSGGRGSTVRNDEDDVLMRLTSGKGNESESSPV
jgi:hypothetical protein